VGGGGGGGGGGVVGFPVDGLKCLYLVLLWIRMFIEQIQNFETFMQNNCEDR